MQVKELMERDFLTVHEDDSALDVGNNLERGNAAAAVVVRHDEVVGIISKETFFSKISVFCERRLEEFKVKELMEYDVESVNEDEDVKVAASKLIESNSTIDRLPVLSGRKLSGMISKQEFTELFAKTMKKKFKVKDLMSFSPVTVEDYTALDKVVTEMLSSGVKRVLVMSGSNLVGVIAVKDISLSLFLEKKLCKSFNPVSILRAEDLMSRGPITVKPGEDAAIAAKIMVDKNFGSLPVVDGGVLQGILTRGCLLKGFQVSWK